MVHRVGAFHPYHHFVAAHRTCEIACSNIDIGFVRVLRHDKAIAARFQLQPADDEIHPFRYTVAIGAGSNHLTRFLHLVQEPHERFELIRVVDLKVFDQFLYGQRPIDIVPHEIEYVLSFDHFGHLFSAFQTSDSRADHVGLYKLPR